MLGDTRHLSLSQTQRNQRRGSQTQDDFLRIAPSVRPLIRHPPEEPLRQSHAWRYPPLVACFRPLSARKSPTGKIVFGNHHAWTDLPWFSVPCGQCIGCRVSKSQDWGTRISHEASCHEASCFVTLTYNNEHLPDDMSVSTREVQLFNKRLRKAIGPFRFLACGEYGDKNWRPHYHMIIFGHDFASTRKLWRTSNGYPVYRSEVLEKCWTSGHSEIGTVTLASAQYVARYCLKKMTGEKAADHYTRLNPLTGEIIKVKPEFLTMSNKPGIGHSWITQFKSDVFPSDFVILDGRKRPIPRYYKLKLEEAEQEELRQKRVHNAKKHSSNNTDWRLVVREESQELRAARLIRELDDEQ